MDSIKAVENWGAPLLIGLGVALFAWGWQAAGGLGPMLSQELVDRPEDFSFWRIFFPQLTAMVGFWATLSLNIPDFTRVATSQKAQVRGQLLGLNTTMPIFAFIGVAVTGATVIAFGEAIWDPNVLLKKFESTKVVTVSVFALVLATLTTNMAANVVAPATAFSNLAPKAIGMRAGCIVTGVIGILMMPWKLLADPSGYVFTWLLGYSALLGPIAGILICDYYMVRKTHFRLADLYRETGPHRGVSTRALVALLLAVSINVPGFLGTIGVVARDGWVSPFMAIYDYAWFTGFGFAFVLYLALKPLSKEAS